MIRLATAALNLALMGVAASPAFSASLTYSESVNGELTGQNVGALDVGLNTVQGQICGAPPFTSLLCSDSDPFQFTLLSGLSIDQMVFTYATTVEGSPINPHINYQFEDPTFAILGFFSLDPFPSASRLEFLGVLPANTVGDYRLANGVFVDGCRDAGPCGFVTDYTWSLRVSPISSVPEPSPLALITVVLVGFAIARRKAA